LGPLALTTAEIAVPLPASMASRRWKCFQARSGLFGSTFPGVSLQKRTERKRVIHQRIGQSPCATAALGRWFSTGAAEGGQLHLAQLAVGGLGGRLAGLVAEASRRERTTRLVPRQTSGGARRADPGAQPERHGSSIMRRASDDQLIGARAQALTVAADPPRSVSSSGRSMGSARRIVPNAAPERRSKIALPGLNSAAAPGPAEKSPLSRSA